jgi:hypothetical protein
VTTALTGPAKVIHNSAKIYDLPEHTNGLQKAQHDSYNLADAVVTRIKTAANNPHRPLPEKETSHDNSKHNGGEEGRARLDLDLGDDEPAIVPQRRRRCCRRKTLLPHQLVPGGAVLCSESATLPQSTKWGHRRICSKTHAKRHRGTLSVDSAVAGSHFGAACGPNVIAVEGDVLPAEQRDMGKQIIADKLILGTQLATEINGVPEEL